tara:strand:- start:3841 stop:4374 length:534 start_codon:yes stop_codon:yes gene_type:complete
VSCVNQFLELRHLELKNLCEIKVTQGEDLFQDICLWVLTTEKAKELCVKEQLLFYILRVVAISAFSKNSPYYYKYRKHKENTFQFQSFHTAISEAPPEDYQKEMKWIDKNLQGLHWFDAKLFEVYYWEGHSLNTLSNETGISRSTINKSICKTKAHLKKEAQRTGGRRGVRSKSDGA